jgi:HAD superfamily hydrolase (TIGR01459 family)
MSHSTAPDVIDRLSAIAPAYDALLCDAWGVIHDGRRLFPGVEEALQEFRARRGPVLILTNAPRPNEIIPPQLDRLGLARAAYDGVVTSGDATRAEIESRLAAPAYRIGPQKDDPLFEGLAIRFAPLEEAGFIVCTGLEDDAVETPEDYREVLARAATRDLLMVCANPDKVVRWGGRLVYCAGALAELYEGLGGRVVYGGKPHPPIYRLALARLAVVAGRPVPPERILAVGDGVATDIVGANRAGIDAVFIAGADGIHEGAHSPAAIAAALGAAGAHAVAAMERLQW